jgi:hypothetical protein
MDPECGPDEPGEAFGKLCKQRPIALPGGVDHASGDARRLLRTDEGGCIVAEPCVVQVVVGVEPARDRWLIANRAALLGWVCRR